MGHRRVYVGHGLFVRRGAPVWTGSPSTPFGPIGCRVMTSSPAEFGKLIADEIDYRAKVIPSIGIQPE